MAESTTVGDLTAEELALIYPCAACSNDTKPWRWKKDKAPWAIKRQTKDLCSRCYQRSRQPLRQARRRGEPDPEIKVKEVRRRRITPRPSAAQLASQRDRHNAQGLDRYIKRRNQRLAAKARRERKAV